MQNNVLTLSKGQKLNFDQQFSTIQVTNKKSNVLDKYQELQNIYTSKFQELIFVVDDVKCVADKLINICLANDISRRNLWKVNVYLKLVEKHKRYNYCVEKLKALKNDDVLQNLIDKYISKDKEVCRRIDLIMSTQIKFPNLTSESIISENKYNKIIKKKHQKLIPVFKQLNNDEYIEEYDNLRRGFTKFIERVGAINLFKNVFMSDISCIQFNYTQINEIYYCNYLLQKLEKYETRTKSNLEIEIDSIENSLFDLVIDFDKNVVALREALQRVTN